MGRTDARHSAPGSGAEETAISGGGGEGGHRAWYFSAYGCPLEMVSSFKYLGRVISAADNDWPVVVKNLAQARKFCSRMSRILSREVAALRVSGFFLRPWSRRYYSSGRRPVWSTPAWARPWGGFQTQVARRMTGRIPRRTLDGRCRYTLTVASREDSGFLTMEKYIRWR